MSLLCSYSKVVWRGSFYVGSQRQHGIGDNKLLWCLWFSLIKATSLKIKTAFHFVKIFSNKGWDENLIKISFYVFYLQLIDQGLYHLAYCSSKKFLGVFRLKVMWHLKRVSYENMLALKVPCSESMYPRPEISGVCRVW